MTAGAPLEGVVTAGAPLEGVVTAGASLEVPPLLSSFSSSEASSSPVPSSPPSFRSFKLTSPLTSS